MINERWQTVCVDFTKLPPNPFIFLLPSLFSLAGTQDAVLVGLHTCGDLAPSTLRMFRAKQELRAVCSVGCCYHLLSEEFDHDRQGKNTSCLYAHTHTHTLISISMVEQVFKQDKPCGIAFLFIMFFPAMCIPYQYLVKK